MFNFFDAFKEFYPCTYCAKDLRKEMQKSRINANYLGNFGGFMGVLKGGLFVSGFIWFFISSF
ncbi:MAG: hypothetical protein ACK56F_11990 [bacterium]